MTEQFRITAGLDLGAIEATVYGDTWVELKVSDDDGDHVQYIEVHDARALRVWLDLVIPPDSVDETSALVRAGDYMAHELGKFGRSTDAWWAARGLGGHQLCTVCSPSDYVLKREHLEGWLRVAEQEAQLGPMDWAETFRRALRASPSAQETKPKPTIEGLERLLQAEDPTPVHVWPDGSVHDAPPPPEEASALLCKCGRKLPHRFVEGECGEVKAPEKPCTFFIPFDPRPGPHHSPVCARHTENGKADSGKP